MDDVLTHELIHAFDACRVKYDRNNLKHLACTSVGVLDLFFFFCIHNGNLEAVAHDFVQFCILSNAGFLDIFFVNVNSTSLLIA